MGKRSFSTLMNKVPSMAILIVAIGLKAVLLSMDAFPFNADEAIVGLMARHILAGDWMTFFYGQAYMGSMDATLVAAGFAVFGKHVLVIRVIQVLLYAGTITTTMHLGGKIFTSRKVGWIAGLFMAIPSVNVTLYSTISLGGYGEALLIGNLLLILSLNIVDRPEITRQYLLWGVLAGVGFWAFGLTLIYSLPSFLVILWKARPTLRSKKMRIAIVLLCLAFVVGASPWVIWAVLHGPGSLVQELFGSAIAGASTGNFLAAVLHRLKNFVLFGVTVIFGMRPPWEIRWLALPLLPVALAFWLVVCAKTILVLNQRGKERVGRLLLFAVCVLLIIGFIVTPFGADPSGRYFLPLVVPMSLFAADFLVHRVPKMRNAWVALGIVALLGFNLWGTIQSALRNPPGITTQFDSITWIDHQYDQDLIEFLDAHGALRGYSNYWVAYPLAFLSEERLIYIPQLPYHQDFRYTQRDNRYAAYITLVEESDRVAYITTNHADLDRALRLEFRANGVAFEEVQIGNYRVFYDLDPNIHLADLDAKWLMD